MLVAADSEVLGRQVGNGDEVEDTEVDMVSEMPKWKYRCYDLKGIMWMLLVVSFY